ncbi:hypothetical protein WA158_002149 [Blastocystis sp. Blastoise]
MSATVEDPTVPEEPTDSTVTTEAVPSSTAMVLENENEDAQYYQDEDAQYYQDEDPEAFQQHMPINADVYEEPNYDGTEGDYYQDGYVYDDYEMDPNDPMATTQENNQETAENMAVEQETAENMAVEQETTENNTVEQETATTPLSSIPVTSNPMPASTTSPSIPQSEPTVPSEPSEPAANTQVPLSKTDEVISASVLSEGPHISGIETKKSTPVMIPAPPASVQRLLEDPSNASLKDKLANVIIVDTPTTTNDDNTVNNNNSIQPEKKVEEESKTIHMKAFAELGKQYNLDLDLCNVIAQSPLKYTEEQLAIEVAEATKKATIEAQTVINGLAGTLKRLQEECQSLRKSNIDLSNQNEEMRTVINEVYDKISVIKQEGITEASTHYEEEIRKLEEHYKNQITDLTNQLKDNDIAFESMKTEIIDMKNNEMRLVQELNKSTTECDRLKTEYDNCAASRLAEENDYSTKLKDKTKEIEEYMNKYEQIKNLLEIERKKISENIKDINIYTMNQEREKQKFDEKCAENQKLQSTVDDLRSQLTSSQISLHKKEEDNQIALQSLASLRAQYDQINSELVSLHAVLDGQKNMFASRTSLELEPYKTKVNQLTQEVASLKIQLFDIQHGSSSSTSGAEAPEDGSALAKDIQARLNHLSGLYDKQIQENHDLLVWCGQLLTTIRGSDPSA